VEAKRIRDSRWKEGNGVDGKAKYEEEKTWRNAEKRQLEKVCSGISSVKNAVIFFVTPINKPLSILEENTSLN
jgi:hypothetical protein